MFHSLSFCVAWLSTMNIYYLGSCVGTKFNVCRFHSLHSQQNIQQFFVLFALLPLFPPEQILAARSPGSWSWKEKAGLGLQASRGCGWRGVELSTQVPGSSRMGHAPPQPGGPSQLGCPEITPETKWLKQQTFVSHSSGGWEIQSQSEGRFGS